MKISKCVICNKRSGGKRSTQDSVTGLPPYTVWVHKKCKPEWKMINLGVRYGTSVDCLRSFMKNPNQIGTLLMMHTVDFFRNRWFVDLTSRFLINGH